MNVFNLKGQVGAFNNMYSSFGLHKLNKPALAVVVLPLPQPKPKPQPQPQPQPQSQSNTKQRKFRIESN